MTPFPGSFIYKFLNVFNSDKLFVLHHYSYLSLYYTTMESIHGLLSHSLFLLVKHWSMLGTCNNTDTVYSVNLHFGCWDWASAQEKSAVPYELTTFWAMFWNTGPILQITFCIFWLTVSAIKNIPKHTLIVATRPVNNIELHLQQNLFIFYSKYESLVIPRMRESQFYEESNDRKINILI